MAPSQVAVEIVDIFNDIISNNLRYCALCLRTEEERELVEPNCFMKCLCILRIRIPMVNTICFMCEASAKQAVNLMHAINFSFVINRWFKNMSTKLKYIDEMPNHLDKFMETTRGPALTLPVLSLAQSWAVARRRYDLVQTEVLLVSDAAPTESDRDVIEVNLTSSTYANTPKPAQSTPVPDDEQKPNEKATSTPETENVVVIEDDEEDCVAVPPSFPLLTAALTKPSAIPLPPPPSAVPPASVPPTASTAGNDPPAPLPRLVPVDRILEYENAASFLRDEMQLLVRHKDGVSFVMHPVVQDSGGALRVPGLRCRVRRGRLEPEPEPGDAGAPPGGRGAQPAVSHRHLIEYSDVIVLDNTDGVPAPQGAGGTRGGTAGGGDSVTRAAQPVQGGRIDWEDKIPMDVISFMDATDPYADRILNRGSPAESRQSKRPHLDKDVIDLC